MDNKYWAWGMEHGAQEAPGARGDEFFPSSPASPASLSPLSSHLLTSPYKLVVKNHTKNKYYTEIMV
jgi:hypothetical protein